MIPGYGRSAYKALTESLQIDYKSLAGGRMADVPVDEGNSSIPFQRRHEN